MDAGFRDKFQAIISTTKQYGGSIDTVSGEFMNNLQEIDPTFTSATTENTI